MFLLKLCYLNIIKYHHNRRIGEKAKVVETETKIQNAKLKSGSSRQKHINRLKVIAGILTLCGIGLFAFLVYSVGLTNVLSGIEKIGFSGFLAILFIYFLRIFFRGTAWKLSVYEPYKLDLRDTIPAVIIGEALSSLIPLGILISGSAKAVAVKNRVPLVVGFSSVATENLFYSLVTGLFIIGGALTFLRTFDIPENWVLTLDVLICLILAFIVLGIIVVIRQWHFASEFCEWLYHRNIGARFLESGRHQVRLFENLIYGFYRRYPRRFLPIIFCQIVFHALGVLEIWFILSRISEVFPNFQTAFLLESVNRLILVVFKLIPFVIGIDEAGAQFVTETLALGAGVGVTMAIIRRGRVLFWVAVGLSIIIKREITLADIKDVNPENHKNEISAS